MPPVKEEIFMKGVGGLALFKLWRSQNRMSVACG
jgi:hypothetical protein